MKLAIITSSDKGYAGQREDESGKVICEIAKKYGYEIVDQVILPDDIEMLSNKMKELSDKEIADLILTTGGTGFSVRDITPEATRLIIEREVPGICEAMRYSSLQITKRAMLSRAVAGIRKNTLIVNLPGSPKAVRENLEFVIEDLKHGIEILKGSATECARK